MTTDYTDSDSSAKFQVEDLTPEGFELLCKDLAEEWAAHNLKDRHYEIFYRKYEPIDIVITETGSEAIPMGEVLGSSRKKNGEHFIECKFYKANLGLEVLGKAYLMTLRYKPKTLTIATTSDLTDRARDFANWLSKELNDFACSLWNPINAQSNNVRILADDDSFMDKFVSPFHLEFWRVFEDGVFKRSLIASQKDSNHGKKIPFNSYSTYYFEAAIINRNKSSKSKSYTAFLLLGYGDGLKVQTELNVEIGIDGALMISGTISKIEEQINIVSALLIIKNNIGEDILPIADFPIIVNTVGFTLPDFRERISINLYESLIVYQKQPLLFISGEGGIGKTFLCENICRLAKADGYNVAHCPLILESEPAFIIELLWLLLPAELRSTLQKEEVAAFTSEFLEIFFSHFGANCNALECALLRNILIDNNWKEKDGDVIISAIARVICSSPQRTIIVLSNCHRLSGSCANALKALFSSLETNYWASGKIKIIVEYRSSKEDSTSSWERLLQWMEQILANRIDKCSLKELDTCDVISALSGKIISSDYDLAMDLVLRKSGGNPLYINTLFQSLIEHGILIPNIVGNRQLYTLNSLKELRDFVVELTPNIESVLIRRLNYWHERLPIIEKKVSGYLLSISALVGLDISLSLLGVLFNEDVDLVENVLLRLQGGGLVERVNEDFFRFAHEYISNASLIWLEGQDEKYEFIQQAIAYCKPSNFTNAFANGRLNKYLRRNENAVVAFNAALQFSNGVFGKMYRCHKEILGALEKSNLDETETILFHANLQKIVSIGDYLASTKEIIIYNKLGIIELQKYKNFSLPARPLFRQYYHNIAHSSLKRNNLNDFKVYSNLSLKYCSIDLEYAQFLNRLIKCATLIGDFSIGRKAGLLAISIQSENTHKADFDLESVVWGTLYLLYSMHSRDSATAIINQLLKCPASERQLCHNYSLAVTQMAINRDCDSASQLLQKMEALVEKVAIKSLRASISNLTALLHILKDNIVSANEKFRMASIDAAWLELTQSELQFSSNYLITSAILNDIDNSKNIYLRVMLLTKNLNEQRRVLILDQLFTSAENAIKSKLNLAGLKELSLLPNNMEQDYSIINIIIKNSVILNQAQPLFYPHPFEFGFSASEVDKAIHQKSENVIILNYETNTQGLEIIC